MRINIRRYSILAIHAISSFIFIKKIHCFAKKMFQGGIDLTLVGPTDIGISEKGSKTITEPATKESGVQGGATSPPQTQEGSE